MVFANPPLLLSVDKVTISAHIDLAECEFRPNHHFFRSSDRDQYQDYRKEHKMSLQCELGVNQIYKAVTKTKVGIYSSLNFSYGLG